MSYLYSVLSKVSNVRPVTLHLPSGICRCSQVYSGHFSSWASSICKTRQPKPINTSNIGEQNSNQLNNTILCNKNNKRSFLQLTLHASTYYWSFMQVHITGPSSRIINIHDANVFYITFVK